MLKEKIFLYLLLFSSINVALIKGKDTKGFTFIKAVLVSEGITDSVKIYSYKTQYESLLQSILSKIDREDDIYDQNEDMFKYLHKSYLIKYESNPRISKIFEKKFYNCVTASVLYYAICLDLNFDTKIYSTPYHVFLKVFYNSKPIRVDLTDPIDGFDYKEDRNIVFENLLKSKRITEEELNERGLDSIYNDFIFETKEITPDNLIQIVKCNLAIELVNDEKYDSTFAVTASALKMDPYFKDAQENFEYIWISAIQEYSRTNELEKIDTLVSTALMFPEFSTDFKKDILLISGGLINDYIQERKLIADIDSIYLKCEKAMKNESFFEAQMSSVKTSIELYRASVYAKRGFYEDACDIVKNLYIKTNKKEGKIKDAYIEYSKYYIAYLGQNEEFEEALMRADTLLNQIPDYPAIQEFYITVVISCVQTGFYQRNPGKAEKLLLKAAAIIPGSIKAKKTMAALYHEYAMAMVRKNDYKQAKKYIDEGLKHDENNEFLLEDLRLIKERIK